MRAAVVLEGGEAGTRWTDVSVGRVSTPREPPRGAFPLGAAVTIAELTQDPHPVLRRLRAFEPVSWLPALGGWLVTRADVAEAILRDGRAFTVDDPRFTTARVVGPSMLSLDGEEHRRHRDPFARALRAAPTRARLADAAASSADRLVAALAAHDGAAELRRGLAGQLAVAVMADMLGLNVAPAQLLGWYDAIVAGVSSLAGAHQAAGDDSDSAPAPVPAAAAAAFAELSACVENTLVRHDRPSVLTAAAAGGLSVAEIVSNAAVLLFGGIETTEGMICNAIWYLLGDRAALEQVLADPGLAAAAVEEALRLEPAAAVVDRYATADVSLCAAPVRRGDLVTVSLLGANRDPAVFSDPDRFDLRRPNVRQHLAFAIGPHFCVGAQLARLEANAALAALLGHLPSLRLDPDQPSAPYGLVFRKPPSLHVRWDAERC
jgi:cytochrome P450